MNEQKIWLFSMSFEGVDKKLSPSDGLSMHDLIVWFEGINILVKKENTKNINLVAIKEGSYKTEFEIKDESTAEAMTDVHEIIENSEPAAEYSQEKYIDCLKKVVNSKKLNICVEVTNNFDTKKSTFNISPDNFVSKKTEYYYEIDEIEGIVTSIGGKTNGKINIWLDGFSKKIQITEAQDIALKPEYKTSIISAMIEKKVRLDNNKVVAAILLNFKKIGDTSEEISIEKVTRCFEENSIFTMEDFQNFENSRLDSNINDIPIEY